MRWLLWCFCLLAESYETINHYHYHYHTVKQSPSPVITRPLHATVRCLFHFVCFADLHKSGLSRQSLTYDTPLLFYSITQCYWRASASLRGWPGFCARRSCCHGAVRMLIRNVMATSNRWWTLKEDFFCWANVISRKLFSVASTKSSPYQPNFC